MTAGPPLSSPRRVAYISHSSLLGGERVLLRLLSALDRTRTDPLLVIPSEGPLAEAVRSLGIATRVTPVAWWIPATHWSAPEFLAQLEGIEDRTSTLEQLLREERVELVHTNVIVTMEGALAAARLSLPHVWHSRGLFDEKFPPSYFNDLPFLLGAVDALTDRVLCVSDAVSRQMGSYCRKARLQVIRDGFDLEGFLSQPVESGPSFRARHGIPPDARLAVTVGGVQRRKGLLDLVEAAASLRRTRSDLVFLVVGAESDPAFAADLRSRIHALGLESFFRFLGFQANVATVLAHGALLVHPSHSEGFGIVLLEAMAAGKPVVATRCGGPEEIVAEGRTGLLVEPQNPSELAGAIEAVLSNPAAAAEMGRAGRKRVASFSLAETARLTQDVYDELPAVSSAEADARRRAAVSLPREILGRARTAARNVT